MRWIRLFALGLLCLVLISPGAAAVADVSGKWRFVAETPNGNRELDADFQVDGEKVSGKFAKADVKGTFVDGQLDLSFPFTSEDMSGTLKLKGKLDGENLAGTWEFEGYNGAFKAARVK